MKIEKISGVTIVVTVIIIAAMLIVFAAAGGVVNITVITEFNQIV